MTDAYRAQLEAEIAALRKIYVSGIRQTAEGGRQISFQEREDLKATLDDLKAELNGARNPNTKAAFSRGGSR